MLHTSQVWNHIAKNTTRGNRKFGRVDAEVSRQLRSDAQKRRAFFSTQGRRLSTDMTPRLVKA